MPAILFNQATFPEGKAPGWKHTPNGMDGGRFGSVQHRVITDSDGNPLFDRPVVVEGPHAISICWGFAGGTQRYQPLIGLVKEARDTAAPLDGSSVSFWGPPRGFRDSEETPEEAARREAGEEAGASVILASKFLGEFITNETCTASMSPVVVLQVDLSKLEEVKQQTDRGEKIYRAEWFTLPRINQLIQEGIYDGAYTNSFVLISIFGLFRSCVQPSVYPVIDEPWVSG